MNKKIFVRCFVSLFIAVNLFLFGLNHISASEISSDDMSSDTYLQLTGMSLNDIQDLDNDIKDYIVEDLKKQDQTFSEIGEVSYGFEYIYTETIPQIIPYATSPDSGVLLTAVAFKNGSKISIYPTYEFTQDKRPRGRDAFSFQLGAAMRPYDYGGQAWYKDYTMTSWKADGSIVANEQFLNGAIYSGAQLGSPDYAMKIKGCAWVHANLGTGTDKRIALGYAYNPNKLNVSVSFSIGSVGISFSSGSGTVYTTAKIVNLTY